MPKASKPSASETVEVEGYEGHLEKFDGGYTVALERYSAEADLAELFKGLPDDRCQAPHWGYVLTGKVTFRTAPVLYAGAEVVEFSPTDELQRTFDVVTKNMEAAG